MILQVGKAFENAGQCGQGPGRVIPVPKRIIKIDGLQILESLQPVQAIGGKLLAVTQAKLLQSWSFPQVLKTFVLNSSPTCDTPQISSLRFFNLNEVLKTASLNPTALQIQALQTLEARRWISIPHP